MSVYENAIDRFRSKNNCAQAVSYAVLKHFSFEENDATNYSNLMIGFGGGIGSTGHVCGALSGAILTLGVLGVKNRINTDNLSKFSREKAQKIMTAFSSEFGSCNCINLTECDLLAEEGRKKFTDMAVRGNTFENLVGWITNYTVELLIDSVKA